MKRFRKRYIPLFLIGALLILNQMSCMRMVTNTTEQRKKILELGGPEPYFDFYEGAGKKMHYTRTGSDTLPAAVVMVHGSPGSSADNLSYLAHPDLLRVAQVYSVDRPGFGASEYGKAEPSLRQQAAALAPLVRSLRPRKVILTGHSYGGPVIAQFAVDYPELVDGLVIIAGSLDPELEPATWWKAPFDWPLVRNLLPPFLRTSNREILPLKKELQALQPDLQKITCPVLVFQGTKDDLVPAGNADYIRQQMRNSARMELRMLEGMDHFILWSELDRMVAGIIEWVQLSASATR